MLFCNVSLWFSAYLHLQQCPFPAYCVQGSPNIAHNVNKHSAFCHCTGWPISYCSLIYLPSQSVCVCDTLWVRKLVSGNTVKNWMCRSCAMVHPKLHTAPTYSSTRSVGMCVVSSCPPCIGVPFISQLPSCERGHWKTPDANIAINGYYDHTWWG